MASPFLVILLARFYPQKELGLFLSVQAMAVTLSRLALLGLDKGVLWYIPRLSGHGDKANFGLADSVFFCTLINLGLWVLFGLAQALGLIRDYDGLSQASLFYLAAMLASVWPFSLVQLFSAAMEGKRQPQYRVLIGLFLTTSLVPLIALLLKKPLGDSRSLASGMFLGYALGSLAFIPVIRSHFPREKWFKPSRPHLELLRYSLPLALSEWVTSLWSRVDMWMILFLLGPEKVAVYAVMVTITNGLRTVRQTFDPLIIPIVSQLKPEEIGVKLKPSFSYATNLVSTLQLFIACFILIFPKEILALAGKDYVVEVFAFALLVVSNLANGYLGLNGQVLLGMGKSRLVLGITTASLAASLAFSWFFIPWLGVAGAALATALASLGHSVACFVYVRWIRGYRLYEKHLSQNFAVELLFILVFFVFFYRIDALALSLRIALFLGLSSILGLLVYLKRKTYVLR